MHLIINARFILLIKLLYHFRSSADAKTNIKKMVLNLNFIISIIHFFTYILILKVRKVIKFILRYLTI